MTQLGALRSISNTLLYEGCMLYPYRASALKNQRPGWTFGALLPPVYTAANTGESNFMQSQVLAQTPGDSELTVEIRFLQLNPEQEPGVGVNERCVSLSSRMDELLVRSLVSIFAFPVAGASAGQNIQGIAAVGAEPIGNGAFRITIRMRNITAMPEGRLDNRDLALNYSLLSANALLALASGEFISLLDPPESMRGAASTCRQLGVFPVLAGDPQTRSAMLVSPIILYDFPQVAAESRGDYFDSSEIDEMLALRMMTLSDTERLEIQLAGQAGSEILKRTDALSPDEMRRMHGTFRTRGEKGIE